MATGDAVPFEQPIGNTPISELPGMHHSYCLDDINHLHWSQLVRIFLKGRGKIAHLTRLTPQAFDPAFTAWDVEDSILMSCLWSFFCQN